MQHYHFFSLHQNFLLIDDQIVPYKSGLQSVDILKKEGFSNIDVRFVFIK
jgi:hypothetical protein